MPDEEKQDQPRERVAEQPKQETQASKRHEEMQTRPEFPAADDQDRSAPSDESIGGDAEPGPDPETKSP